MPTTNRKRAGAAPSTTPSPESASRPSSQRSVRHQPLMAKPARRCDPLVVAVVVDQSHAGLLRCTSQEKVRGRNSTVIASNRQCQLSPSGSTPELNRHRNHLEGGETIGYLAGSLLIGSKASQLEDDQVADQDKARLDDGAEPSRQ